MSDSPILRSSTLSHRPRSSELKSSILVTIRPPVAFERASISDFLARRMAKIPALAM